MILPDWPAPASVVALSTCRLEDDGQSKDAYCNFNLGQHVGDDPNAVEANRAQLRQHCKGLRDIAWLNQIHGTAIVPADAAVGQALPVDADAAVSDSSGVACAIMTADCLPVLFCDRQGRQVAAAHAGWRGLCEGILAATVAAFDCPRNDLLAWMGPAISARHFEVGAEVLGAFLARWPARNHPAIQQAFSPHSTRSEKYFGDLYQLARIQLTDLGVGGVFGGERCTFAEPEHFFSFRRDGVTGRQASLIYLRDL